MPSNYRKPGSDFWGNAWDDTSFHYETGANDFAKLFSGNTQKSKKMMTEWFRNYLAQNGYNFDFINKMSDAELQSYLNEYVQDSGSNDLFKLVQNYDLDANDVLKDLEELQWAERPEAPNYSQIYKDADLAIQKENADLNALYDDILNRQTANYQQQMQDLNSSYNDYRRQVLSNDYIQNAQLMNTVNSSLSKSRQNALQAGASAGLRLANNVNTLLSAQNQQASQSLQTSNNLAQMLLNQRQAAAGIRSDYNSALNQNAANKANVKAGTAERVENYAGSRMGTQQAIYQNQMDNWENDYSAKYSNNPFADVYKNYNVSKKSSKYGY